MLITCLGHAGLRIETAGGVILCDPWVNPAFLRSWYPFPDNSALDWPALCRTDFLYVSHLHQDHLDRELLRTHVNKDATVVLPGYRHDLLRGELLRLGFSKFAEVRDGIRALNAEVSVGVAVVENPVDGPFGDSALMVRDSSGVIYNQNDARLNRPPFLPSKIDAHFIQFSGAIWYPVAYEMSASQRAEEGRRKRLRQVERAVRAAREVAAQLVVPFAGPPCFLDHELWELNDFDDDVSNIFQDQASFIADAASRGLGNTVLIEPGTVIGLCDGEVQIERTSRTLPYRSKRSYLQAYRDRVIAEASVDPPNTGDAETVASALCVLFQRAMINAPLVCAHVEGCVWVSISGGIEISLDFPRRQVRLAAPEHWTQKISLPYAVVKYALSHRITNWTDDVFLSFRFRTERVGPYNEAVYAYFRALAPEVALIVEQWYAKHPLPYQGMDEGLEVLGVRVPPWCPHLGADLRVFGEVDEQGIVCHMHGWRWRPVTGRSSTRGRLVRDEGSKS